VTTLTWKRSPSQIADAIVADHPLVMTPAAREEIAGLIRQLQAENEALRKDALRYRWLRERDWFSGPLCVLRDPKRVLTRGIGLGADCPSGSRLDAAIDAAMK
jgi:hypothetical protein